MAKDYLNTSSWEDSLDDILTRFKNGEYENQSANDFEKMVNNATGQTQPYITTRYTTAYSSNTTKKVFIPYVNRIIENSTYKTRYEHVMNCFDNVVFNNYPDDKKQGYLKCLERYKEEVYANSGNLKPVEQMVVNDITTYKTKVSGPTVEGFLMGYYDCLLMVKKVLNSTKLARLQLVNSKVSQLVWVQIDKKKKTN